MRRLPQLSKALFLAVLAVPLTAALNILVDEQRNTIMAEGGSVRAGTIVTAKKGEVFYRQPLGRSGIARLSDDLTFSFLGQPITIARTEQLIKARIYGMTAGQVGPGDSVYCTAARRTGKKRTVGLSEVAAVGMDLDAIAKLRHVQTQNCVIDQGRDGSADKAFVADTSNRDTIVPVPIAPTRLELPGLVRMPGESEIRMVFDGPGGILGNMSMSLEVVEEGKRLAFGNGQTLFSASSLPRTVETFGASFVVLSYDKATKSAQIRIDRPFKPVEYGVKTEIR